MMLWLTRFANVKATTHTVSLLAAAILGACSSSAPPPEFAAQVAHEPAARAGATPAPPASAPLDGLCDDGADIVRLSTSGEGAAQIEPDPGLGEARVSWQGDLNEDGRIDSIVNFPGACGNWGECPRGVYVGCDGGRARVVWPPDSYAVALSVGSSTTVVGSRRWHDLVETQRTGGEGEATRARTLRFDGRWYSSP